MASYYRYFVALLAAFGCFFAYFCRLNLSLVIHEMSESEQILVPEVGPIVPLDDDVGSKNADGAKETSSGKKYSRFEEHTLAELSSGRPWWIRKEPSKQSMPIMRLVQPAGSLRENALRVLQGNSVEMLRIDQDFDIAKLDSNKKRDASNGNVRHQWLGSHYLLSAEPKLKWSKEARNDLLGAFFLGYVIFQVPAARAAEMFGAKALILLLGFGTGLSSIVFVLSTRLFGDDVIWAAYLVRLLMGATQAGLFPAIYVLYCRWLPKNERSSLLPVPSAFGRLGTIAMNFLAPLVLRHYGWPMVFFLSGSATLMWAILFMVFGSSSPATSRWLPASELLHIESRMEPRVGSLKRATPTPIISCTTSFAGPTRTGSINTLRELNDETDGSIGLGCAKASNSMDWIKVITNKPIAVLTVVMFSSEWSNMLLLVLLPSYLGPALGMELEQIGSWTIGLVTVYCFGYPLAGAAASYLERATCCTLTSLNIRKLFEALAHVQQACGCLLIALYADKSIILIGLFLIMLGRSTVGGGQCLMPPELSKEYPGTVMAYANAIANLACYFGPMIVNFIVDEPTQLDSWRPLWFISTCLFLACGLIFVLLADNSAQDLTRKAQPAKSISQAQLTLPPYIPPPYSPEQQKGGGASASKGPARGPPPGKPTRRGRGQGTPTDDIQLRMAAFSGEPAGSAEGARQQQANRRSKSPSLTRRI